MLFSNNYAKSDYSFFRESYSSNPKDKGGGRIESDYGKYLLR